MDKKLQLKMAELSDLDSWMELMEVVKHNFPGLDTDKEINDYKQVAIKNINRYSAICVKHKEKVVGVLIFSYNQKCLSCMAVHPEYRQRGIGATMVEKMLCLLPKGEDIWVKTFREDDEKGMAPRALYKKFGFVEDELLIDKNYPHQKFILHRS